MTRYYLGIDSFGGRCLDDEGVRGRVFMCAVIGDCPKLKSLYSSFNHNHGHYAAPRPARDPLPTYGSPCAREELHDHLSEELFKAIGGYFANFSRSVGSISEEIYSRQAVYLSYT